MIDVLGPTRPEIGRAVVVFLVHCKERYAAMAPRKPKRAKGLREGYADIDRNRIKGRIWLVRCD